METTNNSKKIATAVNNLATSIYEEYEMYANFKMPVETEYFDGLETLMNIVSAIGELVGNENLHKDDAEEYIHNLEYYTKEFELKRQQLVRQNKEREYRIKVAKEMQEVEARIKAEMGL